MGKNLHGSSKKIAKNFVENFSLFFRGIVLITLCNSWISGGLLEYCIASARNSSRCKSLSDTILKLLTTNSRKSSSDIFVSPDCFALDDVMVPSLWRLLVCLVSPDLLLQIFSHNEQGNFPGWAWKWVFSFREMRGWKGGGGICTAIGLLNCFMFHDFLRIKHMHFSCTLFCFGIN